MPARFTPSNPRSIASLLLLAGVSSLGLARTVWGGPPAEAEPPVTEPAAGDAVVGEDPVAASATDGVPEEPPAAPVLDEGAASVPGASSLRAKMESGMAEIGELAVEARADEDLVRATCVLDKQDRANDVMDLGTSELLIIRDPAASFDAGRSGVGAW
jgi:hypothetical protein